MRRELLVGFLLVAAVAAVYWPVHSYRPVVRDDLSYVFENPVVRRGLSAEGVEYAFTSVVVGNWHPLTMLSHMLDCQIFGGEEENAGGHHVTNVIFHALNTLLLFIALRWMSGAVWKSGFVAALFGLHPLHVESVAWISERKDVLSTFFLLLMLLAYQYYARRPSVARYAVVFVLLALGLMSKPMLVTAPLLLLLLDYWPLARMKLRPAAGVNPAREADEESQEVESAGAESPVEAQDASVDGDDGDEETDAALLKFPGGGETATFGSLVAEKIPLCVLAAASACVTLFVQQASGAMAMLGQELPLSTRLGNAVCSYGLYLEKTFWPSPLAAVYPYTAPRPIDVLIIAAALTAITVAASRLAAAKPYLPVGWFWYLVTLVPVIGLVQVGAEPMADRYTYIPLIGLFFIAAWGGAEAAAEWPTWARSAAAASVLGACAWLTSQQVRTWADSDAMFGHAVAAVPNNFVAMQGLATSYWKEGRLQDARTQLEALVKLEDKLHVKLELPQRALGVLLAELGEPEEALKQLDGAIEVRPPQPEARREKAWLLATYPDEKYRNGREAVQLAQEALDLARVKSPDDWDTLAAAHAEYHDIREAVAAEEQAIDAARRMHADDLLPELEKRLQLFKAGGHYTEKPKRPRRL